MSDDSKDPFAECARCGHIDYHHRPECTNRSSMFVNVGNCDCPGFVAIDKHNDHKYAKLVEEIMRKADLLSDEGSLEKAEGMYDVGKYLLTGSWEW